MGRRKKKNKKHIIECIIIILTIFLGVEYTEDIINCFNNIVNNINNINDFTYTLDKIPEYNNKPYIILNNNEPEFKEEELTTKSFEEYGKLDKYGRCTGAYANIGTELMPTEERESIGHVKPSGWHTVKYDNVEGKYLYNRCHLIGYQLTGENANEKNLITCTRYANTVGMLGFENEVAEYIKKTGNHVLYRVIPVFEGENLLASGIKIEAKSVEDNGKGVKFHVYVYNIQKGIEINYKDGTSKLK